MKLTQQEVVVVFQALNLMEDGKVRTFPLSQLSDAAKVISEIKEKAVKDEVVLEGEHELEFSLDQRKLIKDCINRGWPAAFAESVISLKEKLEA